MRKINRIENINYVLKQPSFKKRVQTNYGLNRPKQEKPAEDNLLTVFTSTVKDIFDPQVKERAIRIQEGLCADGTHLHTIV